MADFTGQPIGQVQHAIAQDFLGLPPTYHTDLATMKKQLPTLQAAKQSIQAMTPATPGYQAVKAMADQADTVAAKIEDYEVRVLQAANLSKWKASVGKLDKPLFGNHPLQDLLPKLMKSEERILKSEALHKAIGKWATSTPQPGDMPLDMFLKEANLAPGGQPMQKTLQNLPGNPAQNMLYMPKDVAQNLIRYHKTIGSPQGLQPVLQLYDSMTNLTKAWQTVGFPAHHVRNQVTASFQHIVHDVKDASGSYIRPFKDAMDLRSGKMMQGASRIPGLTHLSDKEASLALMREMIDHDVIHRRGRALAETTGGSPLGLSKIEELLPGRAKPGVFQGAKEAWQKGNWKPWQVSGAFGNELDQFKLIKAGRSVSGSLDDINRMSAYIAKRSQGYSPLAALDEVKKVHYDYSNLTRFETDVMRRLVPFYGWMRQNIPAVLYEVATKPGGKMGQGIQAAATVRGEEPGFVPKYIGEGFAAKTSEDKETGVARFLSRLGLPFEDLGEMISGGGPLGAINPIIKGPAEYLTGNQWYTGRDLRDMYSMSGALFGEPMPFLENVAFNSPLGRPLTTLRTLTDPRKDALAQLANLGSGFRLTDVDMNKAKDVATRELIEDQLRGQPGVRNFERLYVRPENLAQLSPAEQDLYRLYMSREAAARRAAANR
jgi:hypothetical protein